MNICAATMHFCKVCKVVFVCSAVLRDADGGPQQAGSP